MVSVLVPESSGPGSTLASGDTMLCSWARHFQNSHSASLYPGVFGVPANYRELPNKLRGSD